MLHAWKLSFDHPVSGKKLHFTAPPPEDFKPWMDLKGR
jgi:23S rRNA pseudouridine1911/1915/1917 synthase